MEHSSMELMLKNLRLPGLLREYERMAQVAEQENWSYTAYLQALVEQQSSERHQRRIERLLKHSELPEGKTLTTLDQDKLPQKVRRQVATLVEGHFVERAENVLVFGLPGVGKTHLLAAVARELILSKGVRVYFSSSHRLVERLLAAKKVLELEGLLRKLDSFEVMILDDIGYVQQSRDEMEVLFTFLSERYERRSLMISSNLVFSQWDRIFKDPMTTAAAIDRLVHHCIILELNNPSYRAQEAGKRNDNPARGASS